MMNIIEIVNKGNTFDGHYLLIRPLSVDGATADVWLALDTNTVAGDFDGAEIIDKPDREIIKYGLIVAIKIYRPQNALDIEGEQRFRDEYMIVYNCHHINLIHPTHFSIFKDIPYLVLPYCKSGSSELLIGKKLDDDQVWKYILDVSAGLAYLHSLTPPIVHQDIKPANILLDDTQHFAITDFGISSQRGGVHGYYYDEENSGTLAYMAPERFQEGTEPIPQSDVWAFGATLFEILTGKVPFGEEGGKRQIENNNIPSIPHVSNDIQKLIQACMSMKPEERPTAFQIMKSAEAKHFPLKRNRQWLIGAVLFVFLLLVIPVLLFFPKKHVEVDRPKLTAEEQFDKAKSLIGSNNKRELSRGIIIMDSLSKIGYLPAMYETAFTYGWYTHAESKRRKQILNVAYDDLTGMPTEDKYKEKTQHLFRAITLHKDSSSYPCEIAEAYYRMGVYYFYYDSSDKKTLEYWNLAYNWAKRSANDSLKNEIHNQINSLNSYISN